MDGINRIQMSFGNRIDGGTGIAFFDFNDPKIHHVCKLIGCVSNFDKFFVVHKLAPVKIEMYCTITALFYLNLWGIARGSALQKGQNYGNINRHEMAKRRGFSCLENDVSYAAEN